MIRQIKTIFYMLLLIGGIFVMISAWYVVVAIVILIATYFVGKALNFVGEVMDDPQLLKDKFSDENIDAKVKKFEGFMDNLTIKLDEAGDELNRKYPL